MKSPINDGSLLTDESLQADQAEQSVLGGLMLDNEAWDKVVGRLLEKDFYRHNHQVIYKIIRKLAIDQQPFDALTLSEALKECRKLDEAGGELYLFELAKNTPSAANIVAYADIVRRRSVLRQLISKVNEKEKQQKKSVERILKNSDAIGYLELVDTRDEKEAEID